MCKFLKTKYEQLDEQQQDDLALIGIGVAAGIIISVVVSNIAFKHYTKSQENLFMIPSAAAEKMIVQGTTAIIHTHVGDFLIKAVPTVV